VTVYPTGDAADTVLQRRGGRIPSTVSAREDLSVDPARSPQSDPGELGRALQRAVRIHRESGPPDVTLVLHRWEAEAARISAVETVNALLTFTRRVRSRHVGIVVTDRDGALGIDVVYDGVPLRGGPVLQQQDAVVELLRLRLGRSGGTVTVSRTLSHTAVRLTLPD
jgi:hypothetical protein